MTEAEDRLLGQLVDYPERMALALQEGLEAKHFPRHADIYEALRKAFEKDQKHDLFTLSQILPNKTSYITKICTEVSTLHSLPWIQNLKADFRQRKAYERIVKAAGELKNIPDDGKGSLVENCIQSLVSDLKIDEDTKAFSVLMTEAEKDVLIEKLLNPPDDEYYLTGIPKLDFGCQGIPKGQITCIVGRPGRGKTALALQLVANAFIQGAKPIYFTVEHDKMFMFKKVAAANLGIEVSRMNKKTLTKEERSNLNELYDDLIRKKNFYIDSEFNCDFEKLINEVYGLHRLGKINYVVIDYVQNLQSSGKYENETQKLSRISQRILQGARELKIPFILLSQLRKDDKDEDYDKFGYSVLGRIKSASQFAQDASLVLHIGETDDGKDFIFVPKNRAGGLFGVEINFNKKLGRIEGTNTEENNKHIKRIVDIGKNGKAI